MFIERHRARRDKRPDARQREPPTRVFKGEVARADVRASAADNSAAKKGKRLAQSATMPQRLRFGRGLGKRFFLRDLRGRMAAGVNFLELFDRDFGVDRGRVELLVSEQLLDEPDVRAVLQFSSMCVAQL